MLLSLEKIFSYKIYPKKKTTKSTLKIWKFFFLNIYYFYLSKVVTVRSTLMTVSTNHVSIMGLVLMALTLTLVFVQMVPKARIVR